MQSVRPILSVRNLHRSYQSGPKTLTVLAGADIDIFPGEMVGLIGPSGSGKSTLLHAAGLLEKPNAGEVYINGRECLKLSDDKRTAIRRETIGVVYQFHHLQKEFTAEENVVIPQMISGKSEKQSLIEAQRLLTVMGLEPRMHHKPSEMSGGEQQRVAIARALANKPQILLADEPTGNLDPATSSSVFKSLFDLTRMEGVSALVATHNMDLTQYMDRVFTVRDGLVVPLKVPPRV
ncbi:lipoprotein-releasing system ATP-binding protein [Litorimonas taeanensis]|uniref:Lipoprotein-releasing system ATP-binding protein n=1 Tax=Litorimonas taeanensis TaxID=568099 RepID=A0A420WKX4_9PROT|nr:ABC transporter ATP-binding protein [Litorimonas taeanensis]RKQ71640.1 lipoprotein-releasing system ATP-binding protein [Litorimonas taeanensis]